jgi:hypothetical protein
MVKCAHSKKLQTKPPGTWTFEISSLMKLKPPVKLVQVSETTGMLTQPLGGLIDPLQTVTTGEMA